MWIKEENTLFRRGKTLWPTSNGPADATAGLKLSVSAQASAQTPPAGRPLPPNEKGDTLNVQTQTQIHDCAAFGSAHDSNIEERKWMK